MNSGLIEADQHSCRARLAVVIVQVTHSGCFRRVAQKDDFFVSVFEQIFICIWIFQFKVVGLGFFSHFLSCWRRTKPLWINSRECVWVFVCEILNLRLSQYKSAVCCGSRPRESGDKKNMVSTETNPLHWFFVCVTWTCKTEVILRHMLAVLNIPNAASYQHTDGKLV